VAYWLSNDIKVQHGSADTFVRAMGVK